MSNLTNYGKSKKARQRRNKKLREKSIIPKEELQPSNPTEELQPSNATGELQIFAISHNILRIPQGMSMPPFPSVLMDPPLNNSRFDKCRHCGTDNPISRTYCYDCNEVLL